ncbi:MAG: bifunctional homocysteine S-methyltransferase/methylenetetrahydrofolate reductase [Thermomicrobiales bacterium]|nr:bifunctional homocysteine S-methyltransferase/methylenetetrahydrofolate reductase [Thermomicrobiales bacterium]
MTNPLLDKLAHGPLLGDGAMGTSLLAIGHSSDTCLEQLNLTHREDVGSIHRAMIAAGANLIETNTFGGNRYRLEAHGLQDQVRQFNMRAVKIAREAREISGEDVVVAGSIGPTGRTLAPIGQLTVADAEAAFQEQTEALLEGGVDCFLIETMGDLAETKAAITAIRRVSDLPIIASMSFGEDGLTYRHVSPETVATELSALDVQVIGANCSVGPKALLRVITRMRKALNKAERTPKLIAMPNAGFPTVANGRLVYSATPEYFASFAVDAYNAGADVIGGCCGTTNDHIAAMRKALDGVLPRETEQTAKASAPRISIVDTSDQPSQIKQALGRRFLRCVEIQPPKGLNPTKALEGARLLKEAGVDAITVADSPMARVRMSALTMCYLIQHEVGIETILHYTTRDRSMMGLQSDLLGAHASGVRNILALTGDPPSLGDNIASTGVFDVDSIDSDHLGYEPGADSAGNINRSQRQLHDSLRRRSDQSRFGGRSATTPSQDRGRCRVRDDATDLDPQVWLTSSRYMASQSCRFRHDRYPAAAELEACGVPAQRTPRITLTNEARHRMKLAGEHGRQEGIKMAQELLLELRRYAEGVYLMPSFGGMRPLPR